MNSWNLILATVIIFGAGVITGGLLVEHVVQPHPKFIHHPPVAPVATTAPVTNNPPVVRSADLLNLKQPALLTQEFVQKLDDQLQLTPAQRDAIQKIICNGQEQNHSIITNCTAQYHQVLQEVRQHIREQLNPDQLKEFEKLLKQMRPPAHKPAGTNALVILPGATNSLTALSTNAAAN